MFAQVEVSLPHEANKFDETINIPITVSDLGWFGIRSYSFRLNYDRSILKVISIIDKKTLSDKRTWDVNSRSDENGLRIWADGRYSISGSGTLLIIKFKIIADEGKSDLILEQFIFNNGFPSAKITNGSIRVISEKMIFFSKTGSGEGVISIDDEKFDLPFEKLLEKGKSYNIQAYPSNNSKFISWEGALESNENPENYIVDNNLELRAKFELKTYTVSSLVSPDGFGTVDGNGIYHFGDLVQLKANPFEGKEFLNWTVGDEVLSEEQAYQFNVYYSLDVMANFESILYQITTASEPLEAGQVTGAGYYYFNQTANLETTSNENWIFTNWTENGEFVSADSSLSFNVTEDRNLTANYTLLTNINTAQESDLTIPNSFILDPYPNPFNPSTSFRFGIKNRSYITFYILDVTGRIVSAIFNSEEIFSGIYEKRFTAANLPSGVYFYHFEVFDQILNERYNRNGKILLLK